MRRDFACLLAQTACHVRYPWNNYATLLCSQDIALSILGSDIMYTYTTLQPLVQPLVRLHQRLDS